MQVIWDDDLTEGERSRLLRPGSPVDRRPDVLVVGGGVVGLAVAVACRRAGLGRVVVIERSDVLAAAASGANSGAIAPDMHEFTDPPEFVALGRRSLALYREWDDGAFGLWPARWLSVFPAGAAPLVSRQHVAARAPAPVSLLDESDVATLEPFVRMPPGGTAHLVDGQYGVNPRRVVGVLASRAEAVLTGVTMTGVRVRGDRVLAVRTTAGDFHPGAVVMATGLVPAPWSDGVRQAWVKGHMVALAPGPWSLTSVLSGPIGGGTPLPGGAVISGGTFDDDVEPVLRPEISDGLARDLARLVPAARNATVTHRWYCLRPRIEGRQPVIDRLPGTTNAWFAGGHFTTGLMMAPATGEAVASWIQTSEPPPLVRTFTLP
jgi:glycine/D-amino acid oxidase-like deaminating enzyme